MESDEEAYKRTYLSILMTILATCSVRSYVCDSTQPLWNIQPDRARNLSKRVTIEEWIYFQNSVVRPHEALFAV